MAEINRDILIPYLDAYKKYLDNQARGQSVRPICDVDEEYKREVAKTARELLNLESWPQAVIGDGTIGAFSIKAVSRNKALVGSYQVLAFKNTVNKNIAESERILYDLYYKNKEQECFEQICKLFGRKYDLVAYLYFILDPSRYLPLRASIFDSIFKKLGIDLQMSGRCTWDNYHEFLKTVASVRDAMIDHYQIEDIDLLDAHSFLWTTNQDVFTREWKPSATEKPLSVLKVIDVGTAVFHKDYGEGSISKLTEEETYVVFGDKLRIFPYPKAFDKGFLKLV